MYEGIFILEPDLDEEGLKKVILQIEATIAKNGGRVENSKTEGKKPLGYSLRKKQEGIYHFINFSLAPEAVPSLNNTFKINDNIYRVMITKRPVGSK